MKTAALFLLSLPLCAQQPDQIHVTAQTLSASTTAAMFGRLPKSVTAAGVLVCSSASVAITVPLARIQQAMKPNGYTVLSMNAALSVIDASQGRSKAATAFRWGVATVELAALASTWSTLSRTVKDTLTGASLAGAQALTIVSTAIPTHTFLTLQAESPPDPLQIAAGSCAKPATVLVESDNAMKQTEFDVSLPAQK